jgi:hypothetical protein
MPEYECKLQATPSQVPLLGVLFVTTAVVFEIKDDCKIVAMNTRRFPPPWSVEEYNDACFIVQDKNGQKLAYVYFEEEPGRRSAAKLLSKDEARRIAANVAKLPELII